MDVEKQIAYWREGAVSDLEAAETLIQNRKSLQGLFFCHLVIEKILKAHVTKIREEIPPKTHNLNYLSVEAKIEIPPDTRNFFGILTRFQLEGRYPGYSPELPSPQECFKYFATTKALFEWLTKKL
jgi:HEPN domain-containing protein